MDAQDLQRLKSESALNNAVVSTLALSGVLCGAIAFSGRQTDLVEYCFKPSRLTNPANVLHYCGADQRYIMPLEQFQAWQREPANPLYQDGWTLPTKATRLRTIPATNPHKWAWSLFGAALLGAAFLLSKGRERKLLEDLPARREEIKTSWFLSLLSEAFRRRKAEYAAELDYALFQFATERQARQRQISLLTPEEFAIYQEQARLRAHAESQAMLNHATGAPVAALPGQSLDQVNYPGDKVTGARPIFDPWTADLNDLPQEYRYLREFISNTALVLGSQGGGKSWFVRLLALLKKLKGYRVIVFDPNSNRAEWLGVEFYGSYDDIARMMHWYVDEIQERYDAFRQSSMSEAQWREQLWRQGKALSIICEEYSTYADFIDDEDLIRKFVKSANTLSRKQEAPVTFVAHNLTKECLGNVSGVFDIFKRMQRIFLDATTDPATDQPTAAGTGRVKSVDSDDVREIRAPRLAGKITDFRNEAERLQATRQQLELYEQMEGMKSADETSKHPEPEDDKPPERRFTRFALTREQAIAEIERLRNAKRNQTDIILFLWDAKPGDNDAYRNALSEFKKLAKHQQE